MSIAIALNLNSGYTDLISDGLKLWPFDAAEEFSAGVRVEKVSQTVHRSKSIKRTRLSLKRNIVLEASFHFSSQVSHLQPKFEYLHRLYLLFDTPLLLAQSRLLVVYLGTTYRNPTQKLD